MVRLMGLFTLTFLALAHTAPPPSGGAPVAVSLTGIPGQKTFALRIAVARPWRLARYEVTVTDTATRQTWKGRLRLTTSTGSAKRIYRADVFLDGPRAGTGPAVVTLAVRKGESRTIRTIRRRVVIVAAP